MHRRTWLLLWVILPLTSEADVVDVPELGIRFADLANDLPRPQVVERPAGYEAQTHTHSGTTVLSAYRDEASVPADGNLTDSGYRAGLDARFGTNVKAAKKGAATSLAGHGSWTVSDAQRLGPGVVYTWLTYTIVDQHLYKLTVSSLSLTGQMPPEFETLVKAMAGIAFEPIVRSERPVPESTSTSSRKEMPRFVSAGGAGSYPAPSKRRNEQGPVDIEFSIDRQGQVQDLKQKYSASHDLGAAAEALLTDGVFRVPSDWEATGARNQRFTMEFQFALVERGASCPAPQTPPRIPGAEVVAICSQRP